MIWLFVAAIFCSVIAVVRLAALDNEPTAVVAGAALAMALSLWLALGVTTILKVAAI